MLYLPLLAVAVALVAAVSSWATNPIGSAAPAQQGAAPATQLIQDTETTPAPPSDEGGRPEDCPERGGRGGGDGDGSSGSGSAAPQSSPDTAAPPTTQPEIEV